MMRSCGALRCAWAVVYVLTVIELAACNSSTPPPEPVSFQRPTRVAFICVDTTKPLGADAGLVPLSKCNPDPSGLVTSFGLYALVLQSSRGELAAVDVRGWHVVDSRPDIPGKTFVPVGELPVAIVAAPDHPRKVYVANGGSRDISVMNTASVFTVVPGEGATSQRIRLQPADADVAGEPFDMVMSPDQDALFVSSKDAGWLVRIPIMRCASGVTDCPEDGKLDTEGMVRIPVDASWSKLQPEAFSSSAGSDTKEPYRYTCNLKPPLLEIPSVSPPLPSPDADVGAPAPAGLAMDAFCEAGSCTRRLLVADAHQPIVHAVDLDMLGTEVSADAILTPILTGAPTERVAVTPQVPVDLESDAQTQYVYAIDARDGSVLVAQNGRVRNVSVNPLLRPDRLDLGPRVSTPSIVAISLEVLTPDFDVRGPASQWVRAVEQPTVQDDPLQCVDADHQLLRSERLRGIFLAVGATDGTVRIINVHDMGLRACRSCTRGQAPSYSPFMPGYDPLPVVRNRARFMSYAVTDLNAAPDLGPTVTPQFVIDGSAIGVKTDGTTNDTRIAGLDCIQCGDKQAVSFPNDTTSTSGGAAADEDAGVSGTGPGGNAATSGCAAGQGRVCSLADPYVEPRDWQAVYEGPIPGTLGGRGRFLPKHDPDNQTGSLEFGGDTSFCVAGVLGDDELASGDKLVILSPYPTDELRAEQGSACGGCYELDHTESELCKKLIDGRDNDKKPIAFGIRRAFADRLQVTPDLVLPRAASATWEQVDKCFAGLPLTYQVHASDTFVVRDLGGLGFRHRVIADPRTGHCANDPMQEKTRSGRARRGERFDNGLIAFQPRDGSFASLTALNLLGVSNAPKLFVRAADSSSGTGSEGVMPVDLRYSPIDQHLYIVDITTRGLMRQSLDPLSPLVSAYDTIQ